MGILEILSGQQKLECHDGAACGGIFLLLFKIFYQKNNV